MKNYFKNDAKSIVDMLFDAKCFKEQITRDNLNSTEEFIFEMMQTRFDSIKKLQSLMEKIKK